MELSFPTCHYQDCTRTARRLHLDPEAFVSPSVSPSHNQTNTVSHSSPFTPYTALKIGEIAAEVLPPGVLQVLGGDDNLGPWLTQHPDIDKVSFTGSISTGKRVVAATAGTLKRVNLEL